MQVQLLKAKQRKPETNLPESEQYTTLTDFKSFSFLFYLFVLTLSKKKIPLQKFVAA